MKQEITLTEYERRVREWLFHFSGLDASWDIGSNVLKQLHESEVTAEECARIVIWGVHSTTHLSFSFLKQRGDKKVDD